MAYTVGLIFVLLIILISVDDLLWDIFYFFSRLFGKVSQPVIKVEEIRAAVPKMLAVIVAAYNEEHVLKAVISGFIIMIDPVMPALRSSEPSSATATA